MTDVNDSGIGRATTLAGDSSGAQTPRGDADGASSRIRAVWRTTRTLVGAAPIATAYAVVLIACAIITGGDSAPWAAGLKPTIDDGRWWTILTSLVVSPSLAATVVAIIVGSVALALMERGHAPSRTLLAVVGGSTASVALAVVIQAAIVRIPELDPIADATIADPLIAVAAAVAAGSARAGVLWRRRIRTVVGSLLLVFALYAGDAESWARLLAFVVGIIAGRLWTGSEPIETGWRSSVQERRNLIAGFVALIGVGPLAALVAGGGRGPLALAVSTYADVDARLSHRCSDVAAGVSRLCDHQAAALITRGVGPAMLAIVPLILLLLAAVGLRQGRRAGWVLGVATSSVLVVAGASAAFVGAAVLPEAPGMLILERVLWAVSSIGLPLAVLVMLLLTRRAFPVRATRQAARRFIVIVSSAFVGLFAFYLIAETVAHRSWVTTPTPGEAVAEAVRRFVPPALLYTVGQPPVPHHGPGLFIWQWVGVVFWIIVIVCVLALYRRTAFELSAGRDHLLQVMAATDGGTLAWLGTWTGAQHWFSDDGEAAVSYRIDSGVAIAISDPLCAPERRATTVREFVAFAIEKGWTPVFYSIHDDVAAELDAMGWTGMTVAEETVLHPLTWTMAGKAGEKVRHPVTRMQREGVSALWTTWSELSTRHNMQIRQISEEWVADKSLPEMGFTLGSLPEMRDDEVRLMLAVSADDDVLGVTSWLPSWRDGHRYGWTLDVMRRAPEAPNGVMEFLIASAAMRMKEDGIEVLSMSGAPLVTGDDEPSGAVGAVMARVADGLEPLYGFSSLFRFKKKFRPEYRRLSMYYADPMQLGGIGVALVRAYLPFASRRDVLGLARGLFEKRG